MIHVQVPRICWGVIYHSYHYFSIITNCNFDYYLDLHRHITTNMKERYLTCFTFFIHIDSVRQWNDWKMGNLHAISKPFVEDSQLYINIKSRRNG